MRSLAVQIRTACSACGGALPLNAMVPRLACPACSARNDFDDEFWRAILGDEDLGTATILTAGRQVALTVSKRDPACAGCGAAIPAETALAHAEEGSVPCGECGRRTPLRVPPTSFRVSGVRLLVGEDELQLPADGPTAAAPRAARPVAFNCPQCGGVLQVDGSRRVVQCGYCSGSAYLPDDLWHVFHPVAVVRAWYLLGNAGSRRQVRREAADPATAPERLDELSQHVDYEVREAVARNPGTPAEALRRLVEEDGSLAVDAARNPALPRELLPVVAGAGGLSALEALAGREQPGPEVLALVVAELARRMEEGPNDDDFDFSDADDVLEALAGNAGATPEVLAEVMRLARGRPADDRRDCEERLAGHASAPPAVLEELARSDDEDVRRAVARHPAAPPAALEALAAHPDLYTREEVAARKELSPGTLKRLGRDEEYRVREAARANPSYPRFTWLKRLLGG